MSGWHLTHSNYLFNKENHTGSPGEGTFKVLFQVFPSEAFSLLTMEGERFF